MNAYGGSVELGPPTLRYWNVRLDGKRTFLANAASKGARGFRYIVSAVTTPG